ncbi:MAG: vWA domain-containing protein, partial [bacterium]
MKRFAYLLCLAAAVSVCLASVGGALAQGNLECAILQDQNVAFPQMKWLLFAAEDGNPLLDLKTAQISIFEDDRAIPSSSFQLSQQANPNQRVLVSLAIDCSLSMDGNPLLVAKAAARAFVDQLGPNDLVNVYSFAGQFQKLLPEFTQDKQTANAAIDTITSTLATALNDAVIEVVTETANAPQGRKAIILLTDAASEEIAPGHDVSDHT